MAGLVAAIHRNDARRALLWALPIQLEVVILRARPGHAPGRAVKPMGDLGVAGRDHSRIEHAGARLDPAAGNGVAHGDAGRSGRCCDRHVLSRYEGRRQPNGWRDDPGDARSGQLRGRLFRDVARAADPDVGITWDGVVGVRVTLVLGPNGVHATLTTKAVRGGTTTPGVRFVIPLLTVSEPASRPRRCSR